jgi:hypothetical protein
MDEFHHRGQIMVMATRIAHGSSRQQDKRRPHALAARANDVFCNLPDQHHIGMQTVADDRIHGLHISPDQGIKLFQSHFEPAFW